jgi:hypothetical protein
LSDKIAPRFVTICVALRSAMLHSLSLMWLAGRAFAYTLLIKTIIAKLPKVCEIGHTE